jgi:hypothetical protein
MRKTDHPSRRTAYAKSRRTALIVQLDWKMIIRLHGVYEDLYILYRLFKRTAYHYSLLWNG